MIKRYATNWSVAYDHKNFIVQNTVRTKSNIWEWGCSLDEWSTLRHPNLLVGSRPYLQIECYPFASKAGAYPRGARWSVNRLLTLPTNTGQVRRNLPDTNTLAYLPGASVTKRERRTPCVNVLNFFISSLMTRPNKLEGLSLETLFQSGLRI